MFNQSFLNLLGVKVPFCFVEKNAFGFSLYRVQQGKRHGF